MNRRSFLKGVAALPQDAPAPPRYTVTRLANGGYRHTMRVSGEPRMDLDILKKMVNAALVESTKEIKRAN